MRILLVEDEEKMAGFVLRGLKAEQFSVDWARDGHQGLEMAIQRPYDAIIMDLMLPGIIGSEVISRIRASSLKTPILVLTARDGVDDKVANFELGADDYLTKPFAFAELVVRIKALLRRPLAMQATTIKVGELEIDQLTRQVRAAGKKIKLTSKEYALLEYMAVNAGKVLSRTMIVEQVWDQSFEGLTNIVDVYVRLLRSKIDEPLGRKLIKTVRNSGYVLSEEDEDF
jgi:DNA-binding response OmpR family regulator